ncbi:MAG: S-ribosylhomocysteine lyase [Clostridia bacterium]|nr:S-ribosylhomocysteine lyase [Clostridia bacterium]
METIASFEVDHTVLTPGIYLSRVDRGVRTYDIRVTLPNKEFLPNPAMHTIEHLFAVHARNGAKGDKIIYFGPMGCRTGFYLLMIDNTDEEAVDLIRETFSFIASYEGTVPGTSEKECGNYREHDLAAAKVVASRYCDVIRDWTADKISY